MSIDTEQFYRKYWGMEAFPPIENTPHFQYIEMLDAFKQEAKGYIKNPNALQILAKHGVQCQVHELEELIDDENAVLKLKFCLEAIQYALSLSKPEKEEEWIPVSDEDLKFMESCDMHPHCNYTAKIMGVDFEGAFLDTDDLLKLGETLIRYAKSK